ncbi:MAG: hypothetical protein J5995_02530 [Muribaculaceae bacterium]|nr:hypothetical protein [Muribaculaceae bacterium]
MIIFANKKLLYYEADKILFADDAFIIPKFTFGRESHSIQAKGKFNNPTAGWQI